MPRNDEFTYLTPQDTGRILQQYAQGCENMGLILARYIPHEVIANEDIPGQRHKKYRDHWLRDTCKRFDFRDDSDWWRIAAATMERWRALTADAVQFEMRLQGRLIIGLGGKGPMETGITLHPVTGLPFIPGSALKGMTRNYALLLMAAQMGVDATDSDKLTKLDEALAAGQHDDVASATVYREVFGTQENAGACRFFDGVMADPGKADKLFTPDVMTPHFRQYYEKSGKRPPADDDSPNPISFMTVSDRLHFTFAVGVRTGMDPALAEQGAAWMQSALRELGIGAKTAAGYGVFVPVRKK